MKREELIKQIKERYLTAHCNPDFKGDAFKFIFDDLSSDAKDEGEPTDTDLANASKAALDHCRKVKCKLIPTPPPSLSAEIAIKKIAVDFFYHWWNAQGSNTEQGFDDWWTLYGELYRTVGDKPTVKEDLTVADEERKFCHADEILDMGACDNAGQLCKDCRFYY